MSEKKLWEERYKSNNTPWAKDRPDFHLADIVRNTRVPVCNVLEIGCGKGENSIWLSERGFKVTGSDISDFAIKQAKQKAKDKNVKCSFVSADFLEHKITGGPFDFAFDRGCFHSFHSDEQKAMFAKKVADYLNPSGLWFSQCGSADDPPRDTGPPRLKAAEIVKAVEPFFEILLMQADYFDSDSSPPPGAWLCFFKKRS